MKNAILIIVVSVLSFVNMNAQTEQITNVRPPETQLRFPDKCKGTWSGMMKIYFHGILKDSVKVVFTVSVLSDNSWIWKTDYISEKMPITKDYILKLKDSSSTIYVLDEGEGVELMDYSFGNKLYSFFETEGVFLTSTYELLGEKLIFEVTSGKQLENKHGGVTNYSVDVVQRIEMKKDN